MHAPIFALLFARLRVFPGLKEHLLVRVPWSQRGELSDLSHHAFCLNTRGHHDLQSQIRVEIDMVHAFQFAGASEPWNPV